MDEFEFPPDQTYESMLKLQYQAKYLEIIWVPNKDMHESLQEFDFWHIQTADIVELIGPEKTIALLLENYSNILMTLLDSSQVSDRCPLGYLFMNLTAAMLENAVDV